MQMQLIVFSGRPTEWHKPCFSIFGSLPVALGERCACVRLILSPEVPKLKKFVLSMLVLLGAATSAQAAVIFDFEAETAGNKGTSYVLTSGGVTLTITRIGAVIEVADRTGNFPPSWGNHALSPFLDTTAPQFLLSFSSPFSSISVDVGDFGADPDEFSLTVGVAVASGSQDAATGFPTFTTLSLTGLNATQALLSGGSANFPQSVFWDNITINVDGTVPEPGTLALLGLGLAGLAASRRRKQ